MNYGVIPLTFLISAAVWAQTQPGVSSTGTPLPAWRAFLRQVQYLQTTARTANPADAAVLQKWHQKHIGLTDQEAAQLNQVAAVHVAAIDAVDQQAAAIIRAQRAQFPGGRLPSRGSLPAPSSDLAQLQQQKDTLSLAHIQKLQAGLSFGFIQKAGFLDKSKL